MKTVTATEYKNSALRLLQEVHETNQPIEVTKHGERYAVISPLSDQKPVRQFGAFRDTCKVVGDIDGPIIDEKDWGDLAW